jgi:hypothetical protein
MLTAASGDSLAAFVGKWKLDPAQSRLTDEMEVEAAGPNRYHFIFSPNNVETIVADGSDQPGLYGTTLAAAIEDDHNWKIVRKTKGHTDIVALWRLSQDSKTLTDNFTSYHENGGTTNVRYVYQRIGGLEETPGFVGTWESISENLKSSYEMEIQPFSQQGLMFRTVGTRMMQSLQFDGKDYPGSGPTAEARYTSSGSRIDDETIERTDKVNGKTRSVQKMEVSADGKMLKITIHIPGRDKPNLMVLNRE